MLCGFFELFGRIICEVDFCGRFGGEEFVVVFLDMDMCGGCVVGDCLCCCFVEMLMLVLVSELINIMVSVGLMLLWLEDDLEVMF